MSIKTTLVFRMNQVDSDQRFIINHGHGFVIQAGTVAFLVLLMASACAPAHATVIEFGKNGQKDVRERLNTVQRDRRAGQVEPARPVSRDAVVATSPVSSAPTAIVINAPSNVVATGLTLDEYEDQRTNGDGAAIVFIDSGILTGSESAAPILGANIPVAALTIAPTTQKLADDPAPDASIAPLATPTPMRRLHALALRAARNAGVPSATFHALVTEESAWRVDAISPKGALGLAQLMPGTAVELDVDPLDPAQNLEGGARYLARQHARFGTWALALSAYNAGPRRVADLDGNVPDFPETRGYVARVLTRAARLEAHDPRFSQQPDKDY